MKQYFFKIVGAVLAFIGLVLFLVSFLGPWYVLADHAYAFVDAVFFYSTLYAIPGFVLICVGVVIYQRQIKIRPFLAHDGDIIHSGDVWKRESEPGLFLTTCGLVVSLNDKSTATAHVGYRLVPARRATCRDCIQKEAKTILEVEAFRREY